MKFTVLLSALTGLAAAAPSLEVPQDAISLLGPGPPINEKCTPGQYTCYANTHSVIMVCNAKKRWQVSADCGVGAGCCKAARDKSTAYCVC